MLFYLEMWLNVPLDFPCRLSADLLINQEGVKGDQCVRFPTLKLGTQQSPSLSVTSEENGRRANMKEVILQAVLVKAAL